ncbi:hypothetical protein IS481_12080 [Caldimonas thermodepolymerans]|uniref:Uncharacterized protein n=1 Tax=Caldimonas thermodepolymerans TaxID=215580 RepID=A0A2S5T919_9BURK|nr:hypothetical protein [Caldimonas thermodepolymerans]PPE71481.1 hypothetical protein C1702_00305 [Caldimonas thermodepolymerans]QPC30508.1 hypothetical protein IS481_12080 [Caldimonas thermodepolymerans]RDI02906.1 hypothetical protein DES46_102334 [Caldimonas thermodepolymerans]
MADLTPIPEPIVNPSPNTRVNANLANYHVPERVPAPAGLDPDVDAPDAVDVAKAWWQRETLIGTLSRHYGLDWDDEGDPPDLAWNPYSFYARNKEEFKDLEGYINRGDFDDVYSESAFRRKAELIRKSLEDLETIYRGGFLGTVLGMGASLLDVTTVMPAGMLTKGRAASRLGNALRIGAAAGADAAVTEGGLHLWDTTRTASESFMNIGTAASLGVGLGSLIKGLDPRSPLNPGHPDNPLHPENFAKDNEVIEYRLGQRPEEGDRVGGKDSVGAARSLDDGFAQGEGISGAIQRGAEKVLGNGTPLGRMRHYEGPGFKALAAIVDLGGRITKAMTRGEPLSPDAESIRLIYTQHARGVQEDLRLIYRSANLDVGASRAQFGSRSLLNTFTLGRVDNNRVPKEMFFNGVFRRMSATMLEGNGYSGASHRVALEFQDELKARGFSEQEAAKVWARVEEAAGRIHQMFDRFSSDAVKAGLLDEKSLAKGYGLPILYVRTAINENPRDMENLVMRLLADRPPDDWLEQNGMLPWAQLKEDPAAMNAALKEWRGEAEEAAMAAAVSALADAETRLKRVQDEFDLIANHGLPEAERQRKHRTVAAMKAAVRASEANYYGRALGYQLARIEKAEARLAEIARDYPDLEALADDVAAEFAKTGEQIDTTIAGFPTLIERRRSLKEAMQALSAERKVAKKAGDEVALEVIRAERMKLLEERKAATQELYALRKELDAVAREQRNAARWMEAVARKLDEVRSDKDLVPAGPGVQRVLDEHAERMRLLREKAHEAEQVRQWAVHQWRQVRAGLQVSRKELREARKDARKAARLVKQLRGSTPLVKYVEQLVSNLRGQERAPRSMLLDAVPENGRLRERKLEWTPELWAELAAKGFVETDPVTLVDRYARDMGGRLAIHKALGGRSREDILREVRDYYDDKAARAATEAEKTRISRIRDENLTDIQTTWDRVLGHSDIEDDNAVTWFAEKLRQLGYIRIAGGIIFSAMGDLATAMFAAPGFVRGFRTQSKAYKKLVERALEGDESARELSAILASMETGAHMATSVNALGGGSARAALGFGSGNVRKATEKVDRLMNMVSDRVNVLSGLAGFSNSVRRVAGLVQLSNIARWVADYDNLPQARKVELASVGIDRGSALRLHELFTKYGEKHGELFIPGTPKWLAEEDGDAMAEVLNAALVKAQNRASYTNGFGNTPRLMDKWTGKLLFQFQSYAFQYTNNFILAGIQRGAVTGEWLRFAHIVGISLAAGVLTATARAQLRGEDPFEWSNAQWAKEVVDRAGLLGWLSPYVDGMTKLVGPTVNEVTGMTLIEPSTRYRENGVLESFLGPWASNLKHLSSMLGDVARQEWEPLREKAMRLVPLNQQINGLRFIVESLQGD